MFSKRQTKKPVSPEPPDRVDEASSPDLSQHDPSRHEFKFWTFNAVALTTILFFINHYYLSRFIPMGIVSDHIWSILAVLVCAILAFGMWHVACGMWHVA